jgi:hypothetical protein
MNSQTLKLIGAIVIVLIAALLFLEMRDQAVSGEDDTLLFPGFKKHVNEIDTVSIRYPGDTEPVVLGNASGRWTVSSRDDYPADTAKVRAVLLAMAEAKIVEPKTANPDLHSRLGLTSPDTEGSKGVLVSATINETRFELVFGNVAQSSYRYARIPDQPQTWLIDQNPDIPDSAGDWLLNDLLDIDQTRVRQATITHADGETIHIRRKSPDDSTFVVSEIPAGRELSYATVANGIAGVLSNLKLEDARRSEELADAVTIEFETFDGLSVTVKTARNEDKAWIAIAATSTAEDNAEASSINARVAGWQYRVADHKANLLTRHWDDILKAKSE